MTDAASPLAVLGLAEGATPDAIRKAYRALALRYHPDRNPGDAAAADAFHAVREAYEALAPDDPDAGYDAERVAREMQAAAAEAARRRAGATVAGRAWQLVRVPLDPPRGLGALVARVLRAEPDPAHAVEVHWQGLRDLRWDALIGWAEIAAAQETAETLDLRLTDAAAARLRGAVPAEAFLEAGVYRLPLRDSARLAALVRAQLGGR